MLKGARCLLYWDEMQPVFPEVNRERKILFIEDNFDDYVIVERMLKKSFGKKVTLSWVATGGKGFK